MAHPEKDGFVQPLTLDERLAHIAAAKKRYDTKIPWLADSMANDLKHAFGDKNNSEFVISPDGKVAIARAWSDIDTLRSDLANLVGESKSETRPEDLGRRPQSPERSKIARGVVPRVERPSGAVVLSTKPLPAKEGDKAQPFYVKLRAEAERGLLERDGSGKLYLGFHLDPIHTVHWNNLAAPLTWEVEGPDGVTLKTSKGAAPKVEAKADIDPREFLVDLELAGGLPSKPMVLTVNYFACDDEEEWCRAVTQRYEIAFEVDRDAGRVNAGGGQRGGGGGGRPRGGGGGRRPDPAQMLSRMDANGDGKLSESEVRGPMKERFSRMDSDGDGYVTEAELMKRFQR